MRVGHVGHQNLRRGAVDLADGSKGTGWLPYLVVNRKELLDFLLTLSPAPSCIEVKGYEHAPTRLAELPLDKITMAFFLIHKGGAPDGGTKIEMNLNM